ncbi:MAG: YggS family pyridoxal phosphate-dependent enzyme [Chloroflexi bacterium]|nr:YggS family pyridoxal phosphate-dependent enzyme [Chloroflexota bacterium]
MDEIEKRVHTVLEKINQAAAQANRDPATVTLVAVTKTWPIETLLAAYAAGLRHFGENRAEELATKRPAIEKQLGTDNGIVWHFIGTVQSRKTKIIADYADQFHALDRLKIANRLSQRLLENGRFLPTFLEINISGEASKSGFNCTQWETCATQQAELRTVVNTLKTLPGVSLKGLMTMAPWHAPESEIKTVFARTHQLAQWVQAEMGLERPLQLSMGMTDDYPLAIAAGATHVRVGRALFGSRHR